ncbi:hypothetical protein [Encephalitozoon cuniculi GB-M1]|uniref:UPF0328 protein ECU06_1650 n=1 Tax=Encephalitozoon cuniculi (strain GB-M1) TaxID=284813 RepID=Y6G5_ENCCU|nr:uncharacterized protein ECU06_1650 [Encephalitozoon cuniculi GB-M1]Q8SV60.1 RecName: Full=UPF0328 protein ECU06_1650 [Encephalitozoon cuniculi GB-M1]CAD25526.1 hypothetical protein [Encephalitozoon cuniculi GB-M1]
MTLNVYHIIFIHNLWYGMAHIITLPKRRNCSLSCPSRVRGPEHLAVDHTLSSPALAKPNLPVLSTPEPCSPPANPYPRHQIQFPQQYTPYCTHNEGFINSPHSQSYQYIHFIHISPLPRMNTTHVPEPHRTEQHTENQRHWRKILDIAPIVSIAFPAAMYFIFTKDSFEDSLFLRFITLLLPFSYSAVQYALLHTNWKSHNKPEGILQSMLYYTLNLLLLAFTIISILSIIAFTLAEWEGDDWENNDDPIIFSFILPSFTVPLTYLLSVSCRLVPGHIGFTDTGINVLIDILILLCSTGNLVPAFDEVKHCYYFAIISSILILIRLLREKHGPSEKSALPTAPWRVAILVLILIFAALIYLFMMWVSIDILSDHFALLARARSTPVSKPRQ